jgi:hypothetical protein
MSEVQQRVNTCGKQFSTNRIQEVLKAKLDRDDQHTLPEPKMVNIMKGNENELKRTEKEAILS